MVQGIATPLTRQLETYRHQAVAAPTLLDNGTLAPSHVTQVLTQEGVAGRNRLFPPHLTLWTFLLQVLSPDGSCREALRACFENLRGCLRSYLCKNEPG